MRVPFLELLPTYLELKSELDEAYARVMNSGHYLLGRELEQLETEFAGHCRTTQSIGCGNGLDALQLILRAAGIGPGDEVLVPAHTFIATWLAVSHVGAVPVPVDVEPRYFNINPMLVEAAITVRTRAIIAVHLYGHPAQMDALVAIAKRHRLLVIEDAAQAHGAAIADRRAGALGDAAAFSFYPGKNLGAFSDAGAVTTDDAGLATKVRKLRNYGSEIKYHHDLIGTNSRIDELSAAVIRIKLARLDEWNARRQALAQRYAREIDRSRGFELPTTASGYTHSWHLYVIRHAQRDRVIAEMNRAGVGTGIHYPIPVHLSKAYAGGSWREGSFPVTEAISRTIISIPIGPHLDDASAGHVIATLNSLPLD